MESRVFSAREAAAHLGVAVQTVYTAMRRGRLPYTTQHGLKLIRAADIAAYRETARPGRPPKKRSDK